VGQRQDFSDGPVRVHPLAEDLQPAPDSTRSWCSSWVTTSCHHAQPPPPTALATHGTYQRVCLAQPRRKVHVYEAVRSAHVAARVHCSSLHRDFLPHAVRCQRAAACLRGIGLAGCIFQIHARDSTSACQQHGEATAQKRAGTCLRLAMGSGTKLLEHRLGQVIESTLQLQKELRAF
jgi:hypothetical protein